MLFGVVIPLISYSICAALLAIETGSRKELPTILSSEYTAYLGATAFLCQLGSVFSLGLKRMILSFILCALVAAAIGLIVFRLIWLVREAEMKKHPSVQEVIQYCRENPVTAVNVDHSGITILPGKKEYATPGFRDRYRDRKGRQFSESRELAHFAKMLARELRFRCRKTILKHEDWELDGGYALYGDGHISPTGHGHTSIDYEGYSLTPRK